MTSAKNNNLTVSVAGKNYQISGVEKPGHYSLVAQYVDERIKEIRMSSPQLDQEGSAVACALSIADELLSQRSINARLRKEMENQHTDDSAP